MSNDEQRPADQQPRDFATRKLSDPGATVNLNAAEIAALKADQTSAPTTRKLSDPGATISFRAEDVAGLSDQQAQGQSAPKDPYATVNLSAEEAAQFRSKLHQEQADVTLMGPADIVPPGPPIEGPTMTREIGEPLPVDQQTAIYPASPVSSPPPPAAPAPYQGYAQQPASNPAHQGYTQPGPPREASGPSNPGLPAPPKTGMAFGPAQIAIGIGTVLILLALVLALL